MKKNISPLIFLAFIFLLISPIVLAQVPPDKSLIKSADSPKVYWFQNNAYYWILDEATFNKMSPLWSFANVIEYPAATFNSQILNNPSYKQGPNFVSDNLLIKKTSPTIESTVFLTHNNQRRAFFNYDALIDPSYSLFESNIIDVTQTLRDSISAGDLIYAVGYDSGRISLFRNAFNRVSGVDVLGYARTTTQPWGTGQIQYFKRLNDNSAIVYNPNQNYAYSTYGAIYTKYTARGANIYGFPIGDASDGIVSSITGAKPVYQRFSGGSNIETSINHHFTGPRAGLTVETHTPILEKWAAMGHGASCAGLPISDVYSWQNGVRADFENGYIYWDGQRTIASCEPTQDECTQGETRCLTSSAKQTCGNYDEDIWLEWGNDLTCAFGCNAGTGQCNQGSSCSNGIKDGDESDIDCGGSCSACPNGKSCSFTNTNCQSTYCNPNNICSTPSCTDGWRNGNELGIDCGGSCQACPTPACENPSGGDEVIVNTYMPVGQTFPAIAMNQQGSSITVWQSYLQDGSENGIFAQRFDSNGNKLGNEFQANTYTNGHQEFPAVAIDVSGNFVIAWQSYLQDGSENGIFAQRFDSNGNKLGNEFQANTFTSGRQGFPAVAINSNNGNFVIAWQSSWQDGDDVGIFAQRFDSNGNKLGPEFQVNTYTTAHQTLPRIVVDNNNGNFVITWSSWGQDGSSDGIYARRFDNNGNPFGNEFLINTNTANGQTSPSIAIDSSANFVITWQSFHTGQSNIYAQRFNSNGDRIGGEFLVNSMANSKYPNVAMDSQGDFIIAWRTDWPFNIYAKRFDNNGNLLGNEFQINTYMTFEDDDRPVAAINSKSNFVILWHSWRNDQTPDSNRQYDIIARNFKCAPLCSNGAKDPAETDIDCGGSCQACLDSKMCSINNDCQNSYCNPIKICSIPSCTDGWQNQGETDKDCGGNCGDCQNGKNCLINQDCQSNYCDSNKICSVPTCNDGIQNGNEEGIDCGWTCSRSCNKCEEVINNGNPSDKIDVVFVGSGFNKYEDFTNAVNDAIDYDSNGYGIMYYEPFKSYKDRFNFWRVNELNTFGPNQYEYEIDSLGLAMKSCPHMNQFILLSVEPRFRSHAYLDFRGGGHDRAYVTIGCEYLGTCEWPLDIIDEGENKNFGSSKEEVIRTVVHEFGHSFGGLGDEYDYGKENRLTPTVPNCDESPCTKWRDIQGTSCLNVCGYSNWYKAYTNTMMRYQYNNSSKFETVNERELLKDIQAFSKAGGGGVISTNGVHNLSYVLNLRYENEIISLFGISLVSGEASSSKDGEDYRLNILTTENEVLFSDTFGFPITASFAPPQSWFNEEGEQIFTPAEDAIRTLDIAEVFLSAPYYPDAVAIEILDKDNQLRLRIDVSQYQDLDNDGIGVLDNCPLISNQDQIDTDNDGKGDVCDICIADPQNDMDADSICGDIDNCPLISNPDQLDADKNTVGDACNEFEDSDGDEYANNLDNCPLISNSGQEDSDKDNVGDICDPQTCNNNVLEAGEECDTSTLGGKVCKDFGFDTGALLCSQTCTFDIAQCYDNQFLRGDANSDGVVDISDPIKTLLYLYSSAQISCKETADANDDGKIDISDPQYLLNFIFKNGPSIKQPYPDLGIDTTPENPDLGCESYNPPGQGGGGGGGSVQTVKDALNETKSNKTMDNQTKSFVVNYLEKIQKGNLSISSAPTGAAIYLDGVYKGLTPKTITSLTAGNYTFKLVKSGYKTQTSIVNIMSGKLTTVAVTLQPSLTPISSPAPSPSPYY